MPIESIICPGCGSTTTTEYKKDTWICGTCDHVFKWLNPSAITVTQENQFCECGNPVQFRCVDCGTGVCQWHEGTSSIERKGGWFTASHPAYTVMLSNTVNGENVIDDKRIRWPDANGRRCTRCIQVDVEEAALRFANREVCYRRGCNNAPEAKCPCCGEEYCAQCRYQTKNDMTNSTMPRHLDLDDLDPDYKKALRSQGRIDRLGSLKYQRVIVWASIRSFYEIWDIETSGAIYFGDLLPSPDRCGLCIEGDLGLLDSDIRPIVLEPPGWNDFPKAKSFWGSSKNPERDKAFQEWPTASRKQAEVRVAKIAERLEAKLNEPCFMATPLSQYGASMDYPQMRYRRTKLASHRGDLLGR